MHTEILDWLQKNAEENYRKFSAKLLPQNVKLLGIRIPILRRYARSLIKTGRGIEYLNISPTVFKYQEEFMLYAMILADIKKSPEEKISLMQKFIIYIDSWAICDIFCADLKEVKKTPQLFYDAFQPLVKSQKEYQIRFFYVLALNYFLTVEYLNKIFTLIAAQKYVGYYDKMAVAWLLSITYIKFPEETEEFIFNTPLDKFIFRKTISKICDSFRVTKEAKLHLRTLASSRKA